MSCPFYGEEFTFTQPDGSQLKVKGWGDQHQAVFETLDGYTVTKDPISGFYQYAHLSDGELTPSGVRVDAILPGEIGMHKGLRNSREVTRSQVFSKSGLPPGDTRWKQRREEGKAGLLNRMLSTAVLPAPPKRETVGTYVGLCLLIQFPDVPATISSEEVDKFCNQRQYKGYNNNGSVYDYFLDNSDGKLKYTNIIAPYYTAKKPRAYYTNENVEQPARALGLISEALHFHKQNGFDFTTLSSDNKNFIYALNVFYAGEVVNNWGQGLWPHCYKLNAPYELAPGKLAHDYQITNMGNELSLGTFCHENGHMICDFPDLYDYGPESRGNGIFCLMCAGGNADPKNPIQVGAYLKYKAGWSTELNTLAPGTDAIIGAGVNNFFIHKKSLNEYYIIENRVKNGRDQALPTSGLTIWHIDEFGSNNNEQMTASQHYECTLIQADGRHDLERGGNYGDERDLFAAPHSIRFDATTKPPSLWWDGTPSNLQICDISVAGKQMSFSVK